MTRYISDSNTSPPYIHIRPALIVNAAPFAFFAHTYLPAPCRRLALDELIYLRFPLNPSLFAVLRSSYITFISNCIIKRA